MVLAYDETAAGPLEHEHRRRLYRTIRERPGIYLSALGDAHELSLSTVRHHLRVLEEASAVRSIAYRGKRRYFPAGTDATALRAALSDPATRRVLEALAAIGPARNDRLADELDRDPSTISHHLSRLADDGLVVRERDGRAIRNEVAPVVAAVLADGPAADRFSPAVEAEVG